MTSSDPSLPVGCQSSADTLHDDNLHQGFYTFTQCTSTKALHFHQVYLHQSFTLSPSLPPPKHLHFHPLHFHPVYLYQSFKHLPSLPPPKLYTFTQFTSVKALHFHPVYLYQSFTLSSGFTDCRPVSGLQKLTEIGIVFASSHSVSSKFVQTL